MSRQNGNDYANRLIEQMIADKLTISEIFAVVNSMQERLKRVRKVNKKTNTK